MSPLPANAAKLIPYCKIGAVREDFDCLILNFFFWFLWFLKHIYSTSIAIFNTSQLGHVRTSTNKIYLNGWLNIFYSTLSFQANVTHVTQIIHIQCNRVRSL